MFATDAQTFRKQLHETIICQFNVAQNVADLYKERVHTREVERFRTAHKNILSTHWNEFVSYIPIFCLLLVSCLFTSGQLIVFFQSADSLLVSYLFTSGQLFVYFRSAICLLPVS